MADSQPYQSRYVVVPLVRGMRQTVYGVRTHFIEAGSGETVVLLHGGGESSAAETAWSNTVPGLAPHFRAIALDLISFGYSDKPLIDYSFQTLVDHVAGYIDVMGFERVNIVGQSTGAYVAAKYACDYPERVERLVMIDTNTVARAMGVDLGPLAPGLIAMRDNDGSRPALRRLLETIIHRKELITEERLDFHMALAAQPGVKETRRSLQEYRASLDKNPDQWQVYSLVERLPRLTVPTCLIWGIEDQFAPIHLGRALRELLPDAQYHEVPEGSHHCFHDQPEVVNNLLVRFFSAGAAARREPAPTSPA